MKKEGKTVKNLIYFLFITIVFIGFLAEETYAQPPVIIDQTPTNGSFNNPINTPIRIQFNKTMNTSLTSIELLEENEMKVAGTVQWSQTSLPDDTLTFIPNHALRPATHYGIECNAVAQSGGEKFFGFGFITKYSLADSTPPTVITVSPRNGATGVPIGTRIHIVFSEPMNPETINSTNITISGLSPSDYSVTYEYYDGEIEIKKNTPFSQLTPYTVTITTNVKDLRGNWLKEQYQWSFTTGPSDILPPTVTQTIPAEGDIKVNLFPTFYAVFSEVMEESTFINQVNHITLYDNTAFTDVPLNIYWSNEDVVSFGPQFALIYNHQYTVTIGTGIKDRAGNSLTEKSWSFTTADSGIDSDPIINWGLSKDEQRGMRWDNGHTGVLLQLGAWDDLTNTLTVTAATPPSYSWNLSRHSEELYYFYESSSDEGLSSGNHTITFTIKDDASPQNTITFQRDIFIFDAPLSLSSPSQGATGVSTTPTFQWTYSGTLRPYYYRVYVLDGPDFGSSKIILNGAKVDSGSGIQSLTVPEDKKLAPNTTYYWTVIGINSDENGMTISEGRQFTTGGTPPPVARLAYVWARNEDIYPPELQGRLIAKVEGPSPADIVELKVTGPGGFQYIFTEDDLVASEQLGQFFMHNLTNPLPDGTYTFSVTDIVGRTTTATRDFTYAPVPRVGGATMVPGNNEYVNTTTPTLSWGSVAGAYYYRVFIFDWNFRQVPVYASDFIQETSITVPSGYLFPNAAYKWRVDVFDAPYGNNSSRSNYQQFSTGTPTYTPDISWGYVWNENSYYAGIIKTMGAKVMDTLPNEVTQLRVTWPGGGSYDFTESNVLFNLSSQQGNSYSVSLPGTTTDGTYNFNLQTPRGSDTWSKGQTSSTIPIVDQSSMSPANNSYISSLTPTLTWSAVEGSERYYTVLIMDWKTRYIVYSSATSMNTSLTIPAGVLKPNRSYLWKVFVYDHANTVVADNRSSSAWNCFTTLDGTRFDFNGDSKADILWRNVSSGSPISGWTYVWQMNGTKASDGGAPAKVDDANWQIKGIGDFNHDGTADVFWQHIPSGWTYIWFMRGGTILYGGAPAMVDDPNWQIKGMGDFNGDGKEDVLWQNISTGQPISGWTYLWIMDGSMIAKGEALRQVDASWQIKAIGDFNGDKKADILWQHTSGWLYIWLMDGANVINEGAVLQVTDPSFQIQGIGDFNGDGKADILWYHTTTGWVSLWLMDGFTVSGGGAIRQVGDLDWQIQGIGDYNGDLKTDLLWRNISSGWTLVWIMDGTSIVEEGSPGLVSDPNWQIVH